MTYDEFKQQSAAEAEHRQIVEDVLKLIEERGAAPQLTGVSLAQSFIDLCDEAEPLNRVVDPRVIRKSLQRLYGPLLCRFARHAVTLFQLTHARTLASASGTRRSSSSVAEESKAARD